MFAYKFIRFEMVSNADIWRFDVFFDVFSIVSPNKLLNSRVAGDAMAHVWRHCIVIITRLLVRLRW